MSDKGHLIYRHRLHPTVLQESSVTILLWKGSIVPFCIDEEEPSASFNEVFEWQLLRSWVNISLLLLVGGIRKHSSQEWTTVSASRRLRGGGRMATGKQLRAQWASKEEAGHHWVTGAKEKEGCGPKRKQVEAGESGRQSSTGMTHGNKVTEQQNHRGPPPLGVLAMFPCPLEVFSSAVPQRSGPRRFHAAPGRLNLATLNELHAPELLWSPFLTEILLHLILRSASRRWLSALR